MRSNPAHLRELRLLPHDAPRRDSPAAPHRPYDPQGAAEAPGRQGPRRRPGPRPRRGPRIDRERSAPEDPWRGPDHPRRAWLADRAAHYQARRYGQARDCFTGLLAQGSDAAALRYALGYCHFQLREFPAAQQRFREAVARTPKDGDLRFMLGMTLAQLGREKEARDELRLALRLGLQSEDPAEARRALALLGRILASRPRAGWLLRFGVRAGYDSRPRLEGAAAQAGTSDGETEAGSGVVELDAELGHRWLHGRWGSTSIAYGLRQRIVISDVTSQGAGRAGRAGTPPPELSLHIDRLRLELRASGKRVSGGLRVGGEIELAGLRSFGPLVAALPAEADLRLHLHRLTTTRLALGALGQRSLDPSVEYLSGEGLWFGLSQELQWKRLQAVLGYEIASWWLGTATQPLADCPASEACALETPYTHLAHRLQLSLEVRCLAWLRLRGEAGLAHRTYRPEARYRTLGGQEITLTRKDLTQQYRALVRFRAAKHLWLELSYRYVASTSSVNQETVGMEEGFDRHVAEFGFLLEHW